MYQSQVSIVLDKSGWLKRLKLIQAVAMFVCACPIQSLCLTIYDLAVFDVAINVDLVIFRRQTNTYVRPSSHYLLLFRHW